MTDFFIQTERFTLRPPTVDDADWIAIEISNENVHRWLTGPPYPFNKSDALDWIADQAPECGVFVIQAQRPVGVVGLQNLAGSYGLGYWLRETEWGKGIMTEAAQAAVDWHFSKRDDKIHSGHLPRNHGSRRILENLGFRRTEVRKDYSPFFGEDIDVQKLTLTRADWELRNA